MTIQKELLLLLLTYNPFRVFAGSISSHLVCLRSFTEDPCWEEDETRLPQTAGNQA